ncbi:hypothetical protein J7K41_03295 [Candidatus Micrarchaeota archaeon]|nr:hypothetical protein [Candidatus Micrarchaeota archaeon]
MVSVNRWVIGIVFMIFFVIFFLFTMAQPPQCYVRITQSSHVPPVEIRVSSDCRVGKILVDGSEVRFENTVDTSGNYDVTVSLNLSKGNHTITVITENGHVYTYPFTSYEKECVPGARRSCTTTDGCEGFQTCEDYRWSECRKLPTVCKPGTRKPCAYSPCTVGYKVCNRCGTGYGPCRMER